MFFRYVKKNIFNYNNNNKYFEISYCRVYNVETITNN